MTLCDIFNQCI